MYYQVPRCTNRKAEVFDKTIAGNFVTLLMNYPREVTPPELRKIAHVRHRATHRDSGTRTPGRFRLNHAELTPRHRVALP
jgi:hypothetical protein